MLLETICQSKCLLPNSMSAPASYKSPHSLLLEDLIPTFAERPPKALTLLEGLPHPKSSLTSILPGPGDAGTLPVSLPERDIAPLSLEKCHHTISLLVPLSPDQCNQVKTKEESKVSHQVAPTVCQPFPGTCAILPDS